MLGDMLGVAVHSRRTLAQAWEVIHGLPLINMFNPDARATWLLTEVDPD